MKGLVGSSMVEAEGFLARSSSAFAGGFVKLAPAGRAFQTKQS